MDTLDAARRPIRLLPLLLAAGLSACAGIPAAAPPEKAAMIEPQRATVHRDGDDLLTAGLGLDGLRAMQAPAFADPQRPTPAEVRRRAIWSSWRGIADLSPAGGYGSVYGSVARVPGREYSALATLPGARQPHRVLVQVPDDFDLRRRCIVVAASSGSRGIYGAIAVAGAWGLPRGCAVAYTDKGTGSDYFDLDTATGVAEDGTRAAADAGVALAFAPADADAGGGDGHGHGVAVKHAHSRDNPEADWGRHVKQAAEFALAALAQAYPGQRFGFADTRVIATGISNGGGAVLRAAELDGDWLDAVVAGEPNVQVDAPGARGLYDYVTEAALWMPCANPALGLPPVPEAAARCRSLAAAGWIGAGRGDAALPAGAHEALAYLRAAGWSEEALRSGQTSIGFDLWRSIAVTYASAYGRYGADEHPCGYRFAALAADGRPRPATAAERAGWASEGSGIPPGAGVGLVDANRGGDDAAWAGLHCLRGLWTGDGEAARRVRAGIAEVRAGLPRAGLPVVVVHGLGDGLIPPAFSSAPYVSMARSAGREVRYWQVRNAQHFDAFLALPAFGAMHVPLLPYMYAALDRVDAALDGQGALPADALIEARPRGAGAVDAGQLALPR